MTNKQCDKQCRQIQSSKKCGKTNNPNKSSIPWTFGVILCHLKCLAKQIWNCQYNRRTVYNNRNPSLKQFRCHFIGTFGIPDRRVKRCFAILNKDFYITGIQNSIGFDAASGRLGRDVDTLCNARTTGRSVSFPRVSPDGAFMLYALSDYGTFSIWHRDADLHMIDLRSGREVETSAVNSPEAESYHSWSSNSRWILFNSRRVDGLYTHVYMAHVSDDGTLSKPFLLPQRDPDFYRTFMKSYNIPEFVRGRVTVPERRIVSAAERQPAVTVSFRMQE